jgi:molybdate transport system ATP-binding protein/molybdate transport system permease protein
MALSVQIEKRLPGFSLDVSFEAGDAPVSVLGPSGAGKSMLLRCIAGIDRPDRGHIALGETALFDSARRVHLPARSRRIGMLFQHYALFPHRTVAENIAFGLHRLPRAERQSRVAALLGRVHLAGLEDRYPRQLSGGEQQRVALARALATRPEALLLDEPLSALDTHLRGQVESELQETFRTFRRPSLLVTHNIEEAYRLGSQLMLLARGRVISFGPREEVFLRPPTREAARLTGCKNFSRARPVSATEVEALDWNCRLKIAPLSSATKAPPAFAGIRAHHIDFASAPAGPDAENVFPCWPVRTSETPFRVTLFLHLHAPPSGDSPPHLQAEIYKEKWEKFRDLPLPWHVRLSPQALLLMPE